eukprot:TRINITY_DN3274_c0_g2_i1.p1 TRINITY_DN3274_c0_g2~~TRINITY_DN3274_c0_g2_i1.p1  ORF type:complete len:506 (+),score=137.59 TRINITY_DN3274_c0_g2_i1:64-1581(+)
MSEFEGARDAVMPDRFHDAIISAKREVERSRALLAQHMAGGQSSPPPARAPSSRPDMATPYAAALNTVLAGADSTAARSLPPPSTACFGTTSRAHLPPESAVLGSIPAASEPRPGTALSLALDPAGALAAPGAGSVAGHSVLPATDTITDPCSASAVPDAESAAVVAADAAIQRALLLADGQSPTRAAAPPAEETTPGGSRLPARPPPPLPAARRTSAPLWMPSEPPPQEVTPIPPPAHFQPAAAERSERAALDNLLGYLSTEITTAASGSPSPPRPAAVESSPLRHVAAGGAGRIGSPPFGAAVSPRSSPQRDVAKSPAGAAEEADRLRGLLRQREDEIRQRGVRLEEVRDEIARVSREIGAVRCNTEKASAMMRRDFAQKKAALLLHISDQGSARSASPGASPQPPGRHVDQCTARRSFSSQRSAVTEKRTPRSYPALMPPSPDTVADAAPPPPAPQQHRRSATPEPRGEKWGGVASHARPTASTLARQRRGHSPESRPAWVR